MDAYDISKAKVILTDLVRDGLVYGDDSDILQKVLDNLNHFSSDKSIGYRIDHKKSGFNMTCSVCGYDIPDTALYCPGCGGKVIGKYTKTARDEYRIDTYLYNHDSEDVCRFCIHKSDCPGGVTGGPNGPIYPPCADGEPDQYLDYEELLDNIDQDGNLIDTSDNEAVKEIKDAIESIGQKYLYQPMDSATLTAIEQDVHDLVAKLSYKYSIYENGYTIYINNAPIELLALLPYAFPGIKMNKQYSVIGQKIRGTVTYHGKHMSTNSGTIDIGYKTTYSGIT